MVSSRHVLQPCTRHSRPAEIMRLSDCRHLLSQSPLSYKYAADLFYRVNDACVSENSQRTGPAFDEHVTLMHS